ncbi:hypothetical protein HYQ46_011435 [Verticillium longisporum]|nr:hypothetical protein HYQ46_011435 [Verticillium longisporum]
MPGLSVKDQLGNVAKGMIGRQQRPAPSQIRRAGAAPAARSQHRRSPELQGLRPSVVVDNGRTASSGHECREVPQGVVHHARRGTEEDEDARQRVGDGLLRQLDGGQGNNADRGGVETRQQGVDGAWQSVTDAGDANGEAVHAQCARQTPEDKRDNRTEETILQEINAVEHLGAGRSRERLGDAEELLVLKAS